MIFFVFLVVLCLYVLVPITLSDRVFASLPAGVGVTLITHDACSHTLSHSSRHPPHHPPHRLPLARTGAQCAWKSSATRAHCVDAAMFSVAGASGAAVVVLCVWGEGRGVAGALGGCCCAEWSLFFTKRSACASSRLRRVARYASRTMQVARTSPLQCGARPACMTMTHGVGSSHAARPLLRVCHILSTGACYPCCTPHHG